MWCKCLSFFDNIAVKTSKCVMEVSIFYTEPCCEHNRRFDGSVAPLFKTLCCEHIKKSVMQVSIFFWHNDCEQIKKCDLKFGLFHKTIVNTSKGVMQVSVFFFTALLWTEQKVWCKCWSIFTAFFWTHEEVWCKCRSSFHDIVKAGRERAGQRKELSE